MRRLIAWSARSLRGHVVLALLFVALPLFTLGIITNVRAGYPTADLGMLVAASTLAALLPAIGIWYTVTAPRLRKASDSTRARDERDL